MLGIRITLSTYFLVQKLKIHLNLNKKKSLFLYGILLRISQRFYLPNLFIFLKKLNNVFWNTPCFNRFVSRKNLPHFSIAFYTRTEIYFPNKFPYRGPLHDFSLLVVTICYILLGWDLRYNKDWSETPPMFTQTPPNLYIF